MSEIAERYRRVAAVFTERASEMTPDDWERAAPCEGWVARDVVRHLVEWVPAFFVDSGAPPIAVTVSVDDDPIAAWRALDTRLQQLLDDADASAGAIEHPRAGRHRLDQAIATFVLGDVLIHTWDIARSAGLDETLDAELVHEMLVGMEPLDEALRSSGHYGPRVTVPEDADEQTKLIAFTGRRP